MVYTWLLVLLLEPRAISYKAGLQSYTNGCRIWYSKILGEQFKTGLHEDDGTPFQILLNRLANYFIDGLIGSMTQLLGNFGS